MSKIMILLLVGIITGIAVCFLYRYGFMAIQIKRAVLYIGVPNGARFSSCTGFTKRSLRLKSGKTYRITFEPDLTDGDISAEIYDASKQTAVRLNSEVREGCIHAEKGKRYYLVIRFRSATGSYVLRYSDCKE